MSAIMLHDNIEGICRYCSKPDTMQFGSEPCYGERDRSGNEEFDGEDAFERVFRLVTGHHPAWSNEYGYPQAIDELMNFLAKKYAALCEKPNAINLQCVGCGERFELKVDGETAECPRCHTANGRYLISTERPRPRRSETIASGDVSLGQPSIDEMVNRFLSWPLPASVAADPCATKANTPHRTGITLLTADQARQMLEYVLSGNVEDLSAANGSAQDNDPRPPSIPGKQHKEYA